MVFHGYDGAVYSGRVLSFFTFALLLQLPDEKKRKPRKRDRCYYYKMGSAHQVELERPTDQPIVHQALKPILFKDAYPFGQCDFATEPGDQEADYYDITDGTGVHRICPMVYAT